MARLTPIIVSCISDATRFSPRNSTEAGAVAQLKAALQFAIDGEFQAEVRAVLDSWPEVVALHDLSGAVVGGRSIDHLVIAPGGVTAVRSLVRTSKVSLVSDAVVLGRGREQVRDAMVDDLLRQMSALVALLDGVAVHGAIVFQDALTLPAPVRNGEATIQGVQLLTLSRLESCVRVEAAPRRAPIDIGLVAGRLRSDFESALLSPGRELRLRGR